MKASPVRALAVLALGLTAGCRSGFKAPSPAAGAAKQQPSLVFQGFSARASHDGVLVWEAQAVRAVVNHAGLRARGESVTVVYFRHGRIVSHARADRADIDLKDYGIKADGAVEVRSSDGVILRTPHLDWDNRLQRISSSYPVKILRGHTELTGIGFVGDRDLRDVRILRHVRARALSIGDLRRESKTWRRP